MPIQSEPISRPWRRYLRFSMRGLIITVLVIGAGLGWLVHCADLQRDSVLAIRKTGGIALYDCDTMMKGLLNERKIWAPKWIVDLIGVDFFSDVIAVRLSPAETDAVIANVGRLTHLQALALNGPHINGAGLAHLKALANLSILDLAYSEITDAGLADLKALTGLTHLDLSDTQISDAGLLHLKGLTSLYSLDLRRTRVTDAGIDELQRALPSLSIDR